MTPTRGARKKGGHMPKLKLSSKHCSRKKQREDD
eukprot:CAMPEP_0206504780 /NCGR_PEP_ID=MMETSP0324_2-20121206/55716_1 /ASSEMBLY_ACC=CAM_ASM_000836 /TAXON_ID=2866 /ORGANISM="Crypthecodinium cohnii, Strain Seligo" /LENGTH=33 /DNA_ID= /DNA_START= /DNA_END= /DNA_ORIENTATION=